MDVQIRHHAGRPVRGQHAVHQCLQPVGLGDYHARVFAFFARSQLGFQQLRRSADASERIFDLVRQVAHQPAVGLAQVELPLLPAQLQLLLDGGELEQQRRLVQVQRRGDHLDLQRLPQRTTQQLRLPPHAECASRRLNQ